MRWFLVVMGIAALACVAFAEDEVAEEAPAVDPAAAAMMQEALQPILAAQGIEVEFRTRYDVVQDEGHKLQFGSKDSLMIRRPDRAFATTERDDGRSRELRYDGETLSVYDAREKVYGQFPVPDTLDATLDYLELEIGMPMPLADLFYSDVSHLSGVALSGQIVGTSQVGNWTCDHLAFQGETVDWQVWIEQGEARHLRKFLITHHAIDGEPQFGAIFESWNFEAKAPDETFSFTPPEGADRIPVLARPVGGVEGVR